MRTQIVKSTWLEYYKKKQPISLLKHFNKLKGGNTDFGFSVSMASVYSSMIEGNPIDFDTYLKYSTSGMNTRSKSYKEIEDLIKAYQFAAKTELTGKSLLKAHELLSSTLIAEAKYKGKIRDKEVSVYGGGVKVYTGAAVNILSTEMEGLFNDIAILNKREMSINEVFYFASMLHLVLAQIHPFADGNGRSARLLEKWFLSQKLGVKAWAIQSERLYEVRIKSYYKNINIGKSYSTINYELSLPFLLMLPMALTR